MCLRVDIPDAKKSKEPLTCYKVVARMRCVKATLTFDNYVTPYTNTYIPNSCIEGRENFKPKVMEPADIVPQIGITLALDYNSTEISYGVIHSFAYLKDAVDEAKRLNRTDYTNIYDFIVFKCEIPADVTYFVGIYTRNIISYGSRELKFIEQCA
jgi:hypothetical protein